MAQRVTAMGLRRAMAGKPSGSFFATNMTRALLASQLSTSQSRAVATTTISEPQAHDVLAAQRRRRPVAPHLAVYKKDQTWFGGSAWQRITGASLSGGLYVFAAAYLAAPLLGWHLESASLAAAFAGLPVAVKGGLKFLVAWPFVFHGINGVRHLIWDFGIGFKKAQLMSTGWVLWSVSLLASLGVVAFV